MTAALAVVAAYVLGTFPSAILIARANGIDIAKFGSGNPGASNVTRALGWRKGAWVYGLDALKGALAAGLGLWIDGRPLAYRVRRGGDHRPHVPGDPRLPRRQGRRHRFRRALRAVPDHRSARGRRVVGGDEGDGQGGRRFGRRRRARADRPARRRRAGLGVRGRGRSVRVDRVEARRRTSSG